MTRVDAVKSASGVSGGKAPVDGRSLCVAIRHVGIHRPLQAFRVGIASPQTGPGQDAELHLRHIQPAAVPGRVVELRPLGDASRFHWQKGHKQRRLPVCVQIVQNCSDHWHAGLGLVHQPSHPVGEGMDGTLPCDRHMAPASLGVTGEEQVAGSASHILVAQASETCGPCWQGLPGLGQQLSRTLVEADHRPRAGFAFLPDSVCASLAFYSPQRC